MTGQLADWLYLTDWMISQSVVQLLRYYAVVWGSEKSICSKYFLPVYRLTWKLHFRNFQLSTYQTFSATWVPVTIFQVSSNCTSIHLSSCTGLLSQKSFSSTLIHFQYGLFIVVRIILFVNCLLSVTFRIEAV